MAKKSVRKLSNYLINPRFQLKYTLIVLAVGVFFTVAVALAFREYARVNYEVLTYSQAVAQEMGQLYVDELRRFTETVLVLSAVFLAFLALLVLLVTHRTAGPMFHFKRVFEAIGDGAREERIRLRPHDDFREVAESFNRMMDELTGDNKG